MNQSELQKFFADIDSRMAPNQTPVQSPTEKELELFFERVAIIEKRQSQLDRKEATHFNVFDLIKPDENKLSDILANLLDPDGTHGQGDLFLRLLWRQLGFKYPAKSVRKPTVQREAPTHGIFRYRRRMDVLVEADRLLAIENKINSLEQVDQIKAYLEHLRFCTRLNHKQFSLIYLTPSGERPDSLDPRDRASAQAEGRLHCWSYRRHLRSWLDECRERCGARKIQDFLSSFINYIESNLKGADGIVSEEEDYEQ